MQFDNRQFEQNVSTTMSTLDKLKQSLNLTGAAKGLENVGSAARGINLQPLGAAADVVVAKFSYMQMSIQHYLNNIIDRADAAGRRIISALTIDPVKTGLSEYETQINAVQTILANTESKGTTLEDVNGALDTLNTYADKTIYNFTEMTRNIGTFTAAGVDLDTSVNAIQGIANLAAVSGSNSQQASTAMYQLSQALASGTVKLMDWNSVVNAGMGGQVFQDALKETARVHGVKIDDMIKKNGSFRETLQEGWLTADILTETLSHFTMAAEEGSEQWNEYKKSLMDSGYSEEQANAILKLSNTATDAATKVKTATQLWDTLKETAQSGWTQTWEILFGDFEEAKSLFSELYETIAPLIEASSKARNEMLEGWAKAGGRNDMLESMRNLFEVVSNIAKPIKEAFQNIFPSDTNDKISKLLNFSKGFKDLTASFAEFTAAHGDDIRRIFEGVFSVLDIGWTIIKQLVGGISDLLGYFTGLGGGILGVTAGIGDWLTNLRDAVKETDIFGTAIDAIVGFLGSAIDKFKEFGGSVKEYFDANKFSGLLDFFQGLWNVIKAIGTKIGDIFAPLIDGIVNVFSSSTFMDVLNSGLLGGLIGGVVHFGDKLAEPLQGITDIFEGIAGEDGVLSGVKDILDGVKGSLEAYQNSLKADILQKIAIAIGILAASIFVISSIDADALDHSLGAMGVMFGELMGSLYAFSKMSPELSGVTKSVGLMIGMSIAIAILAGAMKSISSLDWEGVAKGLLGVGALMGELFLFLNGMDNMVDTKGLTSTAFAMILIGTSMKIFASAMKDFGTMNWDEIGKGLASVGALLGEMAIFSMLASGSGNMISTGVGMIAIAAAMKILASAMKDFSGLNWDEIGRGLAAMGGALIELAWAGQMAKGSFGGAMSLLGAAAAMAIMVPVLKSLGSMQWDEIGRGLTVMGIALAELAFGLVLMSGTMSGAGALIIAAGAMLLLVPVLKSLGSMSWGEIVKGLVTLAGAFTVIGLAAFILMPLVPTILALAGAIALFGVATLGIGAGLALIGIGITSIATALAAGATAIVAGIAAIIGGIVELIPTIILGLGDAILAICTVIKECAPAIVETLFVLLTEVCTSLATYVPMIGNALFDLLIGALDILTQRMPELIESAVNVISAFFTGIVDALSGMDTSGLLKGIIGFAIVTALTYALSGIAALIPSAMVGVLGVGALIAEIALVVAAIGALAQIPGLSWLIEEGGDFLQTIGTAIGQFIGGIIGGVAEGATSTLPQVGQNLTDFMTNAQGFITGMQDVDPTMLESVKTLADAILTLTGAGLLDAITSWLTGGSSLSQFAEDLVPFGTAMKNYAAEVAGIDSASIDASVTAAKGLVSVAEAIPSDGAFGTDGIDDFGRNLVSFAKSMKKYGDEVAGMDASAVLNSVAAARGLVQVARLIPDDGTFGTDGIDNFGDNIVDFGKSLKKYSDKVAEVSHASILASVASVRALVSAINSLNGLDTSGISGFKKAVNDLSKTNVDGLVKAFEGASSKLSGIGSKMIDSITNGLKSKSAYLTAAARSIVNTLTTALNNTVSAFGKAGVKFATELANGISMQRTKVNSAILTLISTAVTSLKGYYTSFHSAGSYLVSGFANGISANTYRAAAKARAMAAAAVKAAKDELDEHSPSRVGYEIGDFFGVAFVNAIGDYTKKAYDASADMASSAKNGLRNSISNINAAFGDDNLSPVIRPVLDLSDVRSGAGAIGSLFGAESVGLSAVGSISTMMNRRSQNGGTSEVVSAIDKLRKDLGNVGNTSYTINGITYDHGSELDDAFRTIVRYATIEGRV
jgi:tape measure domain-containing protein